MSLNRDDRRRPDGVCHNATLAMMIGMSRLDIPIIF